MAATIPSTAGGYGVGVLVAAPSNQGQTPQVAGGDPSTGGTSGSTVVVTTPTAGSTPGIGSAPTYALAQVPTISTAGTVTTSGTTPPASNTTTTLPSYSGAPAGYGVFSGVNALPSLGEGVYISPLANGNYGVVGQLAVYQQEAAIAAGYPGIQGTSVSPAQASGTSSLTMLKTLGLVGIGILMVIALLSLFGAFEHRAA